ncbi:MAG TPA: hypothetical protein P5535_07750, partial [Clostridia bacterium]|nr:hypothetical protein [Clostridia bacterium]
MQSKQVNKKVYNDKTENNAERAPRPEKQTSIFVKRKRSFTLVFLGIIALFAVSALITEYNVITGFESIPKAVVWMAKQFIPDAKAWSRLSSILKKLAET